MPLGTTYIQGIASGLDTTSIIEELSEIRRRPIQRMEAQQSVLESKLTLYGSIRASLTALGAMATAFSEPASFVPSTISLSDQDCVVASAATTAEQGSYQITVEALAQAHKISSSSFVESDAELGYTGDFRINGTTVSVGAGDTLEDIRDAINTAGAGVSATILKISETDYRLSVSANLKGLENAIDLVEANDSDILQGIGLLSASTSIKTAVTDGVQSDAVSNAQAVLATELDLTTAVSGTIQINGQDVTIDLAVDTLEDISQRINADVTGVTATIETEEVDGETVSRLQIVGDTGTPTLTDSSNVLQTLGILEKGIADQTLAAQDATITVDGVSVSRSTNSMDDVIPGVSMELVAADPGEAFAMSVTPNTGAVVTGVQNFVSTYNSLVGMINEAQSYDQETEEGGLLFGDLSIIHLEDGLHRMISNAITGVTGDTSRFSSIGITTTASGTLSVDTSDLLTALATDSDAVARLFGLSTDTSASVIDFVAATADTCDSGTAGYAVNITQAAQKATATSAELVGGIAVDEVLTFGGQYSVTLTAGTSLADAAESLNAWFETYNLAYTAAVDGDTLQVSHSLYGSDYQVQISSSLDQGVGGTDLGGALADEQATYVGQDVVGTINGETATGDGQYLVGDDDNDNTAGLRLKITATTTGDLGTVTVARGVASRLSSYITQILDDDTGFITNGAETIETQIEDIEDSIDTTEERVQIYIAGMWEKFLAMEQSLARSQALAEYMTGQLNSLPRNYMDTD